MPTTLIPLRDAVLLARGTQAVDLLQAQTSQDLRHWPDATARLAVLCTPQGRALADLLLWPDGDGGFALALSQDLAEPIAKRLRMFIMRLQCTVNDASLQRHMCGLLRAPGDAPGPLAWPDAPWAIERADGLCRIRLPDAPGQQRMLVVAESEAGVAALAALAQSIPPGPEAAWELARIRAGVAHLGAATSQAFVPQMLNYELLGAIDFKKGCYPGQEVIARTQYRGAIKRRTYRVLAAVAMVPGDEVFDAADPTQPCGMVVNAAPDAASWEALAEIRIAPAEGGASMRLRAADGPALRVASLPYGLAPLP